MALRRYYARLIYNANGGSGAPSSETQEVFTPNSSCTFVISTTKPTRSGYVFLGWSTNSGATTPSYSNPKKSYTSDTINVNSSSTENGTNSLTIYAVWRQSSTNPSIAYSVTLVYNANGGTGAPDPQIIVRDDPNVQVSITISTVTPTRSGYSFLGWAKTSSASTPEYSNPSTSSTSSTYYANVGSESNPDRVVNIYAVWGASLYTITYNKGDYGTGSTQYQTKPHGTSVTLKGAIFTRSGYSQIGWSKTNGGQQNYALGGTYSTNANVTLYPVWGANTYTIYYRKGSYGIGSNVTQPKTHGVSVNLLGEIFYRSGYSQTGWSTSDGGPKIYNLGAEYSNNSDIYLYPFWSARTYHIIYDSNYLASESPNNTHTDSVIYGSSWTTYEGSELWLNRIGYRLVGWSLYRNGPVAYSLSENVSIPWSWDRDITLYAVWEVYGIIRVKHSGEIKNGIVYVKKEGIMKRAIVYVKGNDGIMHQNL